MLACEVSRPLFCEMVNEILARKSYIQILYDDQKSKGGIYQIWCLANGRRYIGSARNFRKRWGLHRTDLDENRHHSYLLQRAWNKYGIKAFVWEILAYVYDINLLGKFEDEYIERFNSADPEFGFNLRPSSDRQSEETRKKISEAHLGKKMSAEAKQKMSEARLGKTYSELGREKPSEKVKQRIREGNLGVKRSEETKQRNREVQLGRKHTEEHNQKIRKSVLEGRDRDGRKCRFRGIKSYSSGSSASIGYKGKRTWFPMVKLEIEAGLMYFYAGTILFKDFVCVDYFPPEEMPSEDRQEELWQMVIRKLTDVGFLGF